MTYEILALQSNVDDGGEDESVHAGGPEFVHACVGPQKDEVGNEEDDQRLPHSIQGVHPKVPCPVRLGR